MVAPSTTSFVGRTRELAVLASWRDERLVTLFGPGGIGKTRLALRHLEVTSCDAIVCELAGARTAAEWCEVMCGALDITLGPRATFDDALDPIGNVLATRGELIVLLDNMEQLIEAAPRVLAGWRQLAPSVRFVVTSRERLRLHGEAVLDVGPLGLTTDAVTLFHDRARTACGGWAPTADDDFAIAEIVERLDGFPLAIELAATRCRVLAPGELRDRLARGLAVLDHGARDAAPRHHTLARAVAWSIDTLRPCERVALIQCTVFRGGFTVAAAEAVVDVADLDAPPTLDLLQALCDKSLVAIRGERRFDLYASIREVAEASGDRSAAESRHAAYYVALGERAGESRHVLERERDNLIAAHARSVARGEGELAARAALVLDDVLAWRGPLHANLALLDAAAAGGDALPAPLRARVLEARGRSRDASGRTAEARTDLEQALALAEHDALTVARVHASLCVLERKQHRRDEAIAHGERAVALAVKLGASRVEAFALGALGAIALERGDLPAALAMMERVQTIARADADPWLEAMSLAYIGHAHHETGALAAAALAFDGATTMLEASGDRRSAAVFAVYRAMVEHERGELEAARDRYARSSLVMAELGIARFDGLCRACLGAVLAQLGDHVGAVRSFDAARAILERAGDPALVLALAIHRLQLEDSAAQVEIARRELVTGNALVGESDDVRFALRILARAVAAHAHDPVGDLVVATDGRWYEPPGATERISLFRNRALRRILLALAETRVRSPGVALGRDQILAAGWPDERMLATAGAHRVRVAISTLRGRGLREILQSRDDGYLLDPTIRITLAGN